MTALYLSEDFNLSAGCALVRRSDASICVIHMGSEDHSNYILPKGRKAIDETLEATVLRRTYEETGYHAKALPLTMSTRATPQVEIGHTPDKASEEQHCTEPIAITVQTLSSGVRIIHWFAAEVDEAQQQDLSTAAGDSKQNVQWMSFDMAADSLSNEEEKGVVRRMQKLYYDSRL